MHTKLPKNVQTTEMAIDSKTRAMVYYLSNMKGLSIRKVAKECHVSKATVWRIKNNPTNNNKTRTSKIETRGRPRKLTKRQERQLRRSIQILREQEGHFTLKRLMWKASIDKNNVSESTVARFLHTEGYHYLQARKKGLLTKTDMKKRRIFARKIQREYNENVWTHDIAFYLDGTAFAYKRNPLDQARAPKSRVWRKKSEGMDYGCTSKGKKTGTGGRVLKLMVAISFDNGVILCKEYEKLNGPNFAKFIDDNFQSMFLKANKSPRRLWLQDGDPSQNSRIAQEAMCRANCELIKIPARSPDINPIENLFKIISDILNKQAIRRKISQESYEQFRHRVISTFESLTIETINNIISSMPKRMREIIRRKGQRLKY